MTVVLQNMLSSVMLKNYKLSNGNVRLHLAAPEICQARNLSSNPRNLSFLNIKINKIQISINFHHFYY